MNQERNTTKTELNVLKEALQAQLRNHWCECRCEGCMLAKRALEAAELAAKPYEHVCTFCGIMFRTKKKHSGSTMPKFCGNHHRVASYRKRKREKMADSVDAQMAGLCFEVI